MKNQHTGIVIDDDSDLVDTVSQFLEFNGFSIIGDANNGCNASTLYEKLSPDFVILDMKMPKYDGTYAIKEIKKLNPNAKIFIVSGYTDHEFLENEVVEVFTKPCNLKQLTKSIKTSLAS